MSWILDIIIALIIGLTIYFSVKNGLIKTAISACSFIVALLITVIFSSTLAETLKETSIAHSIQESTEQKIVDIITESSYSIEDLVKGSSDEFNTMLILAGMDNEDVAEIAGDMILSSITTPSDSIAQTFASNIAKQISEPIIDLIATLLAVIILFFGCQIVLWIVSLVLDLIAKLPIISTFNKGGGLIVGIILAFIRVCLFCFIVDVLIENSSFLGVDLISNLHPERTVLFNFFHNIDIFEFFIS